MTLKAADEPLPAPSVALHVTVVAPTGKEEPEAGEQATSRAPLTASVAVGESHETAVVLPVASTDKLFGRLLITGPVVSRTVTLKEPYAVLPAASVAEHDTLVLPSE